MKKSQYKGFVLPKHEQSMDNRAYGGLQSLTFDRKKKSNASNSSGVNFIKSTNMPLKNTKMVLHK